MKWFLILALAGCSHAPHVSKQRHDAAINAELKYVCDNKIGDLWHLTCIAWACDVTNAGCYQ